MPVPNIKEIDLMHVDVEGVADKVFIGCQDILPKVIFVEIPQADAPEFFCQLVALSVRLMKLFQKFL